VLVKHVIQRGLVSLGITRRQYTARQQHAGCLAADAPGADDSIPNGEQVIYSQVTVSESSKGGLVAHQHASEFGAQGRYLRRALQVRLVARLGKPLVDAVPGCGGAGLHDCRRFGSRGLRRRRQASGRIEPEGQEHARRVTPRHFDRVHHEMPVDMVGVDQQLSRIHHAGHGLVRMAAPLQAEVSHGLEFGQVRAGDLEEVGHQFVRRPTIHQCRKAVEGVEHASTVLLDEVVDLGTEQVEPRRGIHCDDVETRLSGKKWGMGSEAYVGGRLAALDSGADEPASQRGIVRQLLHQEDDVVSPAESLQRSVQLRMAGADRIPQGSGHGGVIQSICARCRPKVYTGAPPWTNALPVM